MGKGLYEGIGDIIYWDITPKGVEEAYSYIGKTMFIGLILERLLRGPTSSMDLYKLIKKNRHYRYLTPKIFFDELFLIAEWGFIQSSIKEE